jgi:hypothetical protein
MHPVPERYHPGIRENPGTASSDLLAALGLTIIAVIDLVTSLLYGFGASAGAH